MKNIKNGISLITLVITIIIMIIISTAIILTINNSQIIGKAKQAKSANDIANVRQAATLIESEMELRLSSGEDLLQGKTKEQYIADKLIEKGFNIDKYSIINDNGQIVIKASGIKDIITTDVNQYILLENGSVLVVGNNSSGQLGVGDLNPRTSYVQIPTNTLSNVKKIYSSENSVFALLNDGTVKVWGNNNYGKLGLGDNTNRNIPTQIPSDKLSNVKEISTLYGNTYAVLNDGTMKSWGYNGGGNLGTGDKIDKLEPTTINITNVKEVKTGNGSIFALLNDGTVKAWGNNAYGTLGNGDSTSRISPTQIPTSYLSDVKEIISNTFTIFAVLNNGTMKSWGSNDDGALGSGGSTSYFPKQIPTDKISDVKQFIRASNSFFVLTNDGKVMAWGSNSYGQLGTGDKSTRSQPVQTMENIRQLMGGSASSYAVTNDGKVMAWGSNSSGQLGTGDTTERTLPTQVILNVKELKRCDFSMYAILNDGSIKVWGSNSSGQLGLGDTQKRLSPTEIPSSKLSNIKTFWGIWYSNITVEQVNGDIKVWGNNSYGKLGLGDTQNRTEPTKLNIF